MKAFNIRSFILCLATSLSLAACGGGSGPATNANPQTVLPSTGGYSGPAPATPDVQSFKLNVWDKLVPDNRCGSCHSENQSPRFVRADDINLAYDLANPLVDLGDPGLSLMVTKVRGGHNCWLASADACGDIVQGYIADWAGDALDGPAKTVQLVPPNLNDPGSSKNFPADSTLFGSTVHPLLIEYCAGCHIEGASIPQSPYFAGADVDAAYEAAQQKMNLDQPANSRFVIRLGSEFHNCWDDCAANATEMMNAIADMADAVPLTEVDGDLVTSKAMKLTEGIISSSGGRYETNVIALYAFKTGSGPTAFDTSGVEPAMDLTLSGQHDWVGGWGIQFTGGKGQASTTSSVKLFNQLASTNEYSIEAWVAPANVSQDGPARIISYSGSSSSRNFMLGQTLYNYDTFNRTDLSNAGGEPQLSTDDDAEVLQASLQHVVVTYDPTSGRRLYVNGQFTGDIDTVSGGLLNNWDDKFAFVIGSEVDGNNEWQGTIRMLAIHNRVLTDSQILQNFEVGVGEKYYVLFNVSDHVGLDDAYVVFEVSQFDSYSYLFNQPFFIVLDEQAAPDNIRMQGIRIGLNGREVALSQGFANLDITITQATYSVEGQQQLSAQGTIVPLEKGSALDEFFLTFEVLGTATNIYVEATPSNPLPPVDLPRGPAIGIRDFAEVNATMAHMTGIPISDASVMATFDRVKQAMPVNPDLGGFISSQQMGVTQLAIQYCSTLVDNTSLRASYWPAFDWNAPLASAFDDRATVVDPLLNNMVGSGLNTQPLRVTLTGEMNVLIDRLRACGGSCETDRVERIMKGTCASVMGSAVMMVQ